MLKLGFIGAGTVGTALAIRLAEKGYPVVAVASRRYESAKKLAGLVTGCRAYENNQAVADKAEVVFITTPDMVIPVVAAQLKWNSGQNVIHCSGADSLDVMEPARLAGARVGGFHPLQTFAGVQIAIENLPGSTFGLEAEEPLLGVLKEMVKALNGDWVILRAADKVAYHAAAVIACNYLITLVKLSTDLWQTFGVPRDQATHSLMPLLKGTLNNIANIGIPNCLTGPIARGDTGTVQKHLNALENIAPELVPTYREMGRQTIPIALAKGRIDETKSNELSRILTPAA
jgi:predicted short-subunit dehydrogenase-like oxidoreductase (DUF2520 family)